jgi:transcriptional regulator with XRE-family HTH domain
MIKLSMSESAPEFGTRLRSCRQSAGMSQQELAERSGLSVRAISDLERGRTRFPYQDSLGRLADALGLAGQARTEFTAAAGRRIATPEAAGAPGSRIVLRPPEPDAIEELARAQHAQPVPDLRELGDDIWESDAELAAFLADLRAVRPAPLG